MKQIKVIIFSYLIISIFATAFAQSQTNIKQAEESINITNFTEHIKKLASDEFAGRAPSSPGEEKTIQLSLIHI